MEDLAWNESLIYRFNRYLHYLRGNRTKSTLMRMPDLALIEKYGISFGRYEVAFFGSITFLFPILRLFLPDHAILGLSQSVDSFFKVKRSAFKFVLCAQKISNDLH